VTDDAYKVCRYVQHYYAKNGYLPGRGECGCSAEFMDQLIVNGVVELIPLYEGGPLVKVILTEKGSRMADQRRR
jgi:hypothetical protein